MSSIETAFTFGTEVTFDSLTIVPLLGTSSSEPDYDTLDVALARGTLHITEVSESGHVPEIKVLNEGQLPVLIIDGEELVGAKQNRTVNLSILIPATADVVVPVTCVEAGRLEPQVAQLRRIIPHALRHGPRRQERPGERVAAAKRDRSSGPVAGVERD